MTRQRHLHDETEGTSVEWRAVLGSLQVEMSNGGDYESFVADTNGRRNDSGEVVVEVRNGFVKEWIQSRMMGQLRRTVESVYGAGTNVILQTADGQGTDSLSGTGMDGDHQTWGAANRDRYRRAVAKENAFRYPLYVGREMSLDNFLTSSSNRVAYDACRAVVESPGEAYNPLFIVAETGFGKSHLCNAVTVGLRAKGRNVIFMPGKRFLDDFVDAARVSKVQDLSDRYRAADVLVLDGIEKLLTKPGTQTFFLDILDYLLSNGSQVVVSANSSHPLSDLLPEIISRLSGGLEVRIDQPDVELKTRAIASFAEDRNLNLMPDALSYLVSRVQSDMRALLGGVARIASELDLSADIDRSTPVSVSPAMAADAAKDLLVAPSPRLATGDEVMQAVSETFGPSVEVLMRAGRGNLATTTARDAAVFLLREETALTIKETGLFLGGRARSTIVESLKRYEARRDAEPSLLQTEAAARQLLHSRRGRG